MDEPQAKRKRALAPEDDHEPERPRRWQATEAVTALEERGLLMDLLQSNAALISQRDSLQQALNAAFAAFGLSQDDARDVAARLSQAHAKDSPADASMRSRADSFSTNARSQMDRECDRRMRDASQASPFAAIGSKMGAARLSLSASETDILNAARKWPEAPSDVAGIFSLAVDLFGIDQPPSNIRTLKKLEELVQSSNFLATAVHDLCPLASQSALPGHKASRGPLLDAIGKKKRAIIASVMESTRGWRYPSDVERAAMFWSVYRLFNFLVFPTAQNLARCPQWLRPLPAQYAFAHPHWVDFIPWPMLRDRLIHTWASYRETEFYSCFLANFSVCVQAVDRSTPLIAVNEAGTDLVLSQTFEACLNNISSFTMKPDFVRLYPELLPCLQQEAVKTPDSHTAEPVFLPTPPPVEVSTARSIEATLNSSYEASNTLPTNLEPPGATGSESLMPELPDWVFSDANVDAFPDDLHNPFTFSDFTMDNASLQF